MEFFIIVGIFLGLALLKEHLSGIETGISVRCDLHVWEVGLQGMHCTKCGRKPGQE
jgi:hypothetical protein